MQNLAFSSLFTHQDQYLDKEELIKNRAPVKGETKENNFGFELKTYKNHVYYQAGSGRPFIFCHGLFGTFRNIGQIGQELAKNHCVIVPCLPMYDLPLKKCTVKGLGEYLETFVKDLNLKNCIVSGNSMGGGTVLNYTLKNLNNVDKVILFSSSGLSFIPMRRGALKIRNYDYLREILADVFYDQSLISTEEYDEVYKTLQLKQNLLRCLSFTRSTKKDLLHDELHMLKMPTLIIWGKNDNVTPVHIGNDFKRLIPHAEFHALDQCGHVPSYEKPEECLEVIKPFLEV